MDKGKLLFLGQLPLCFGVWVKGGTIRKGMENDSQGKERRRVIWKKKKQEGVSWRQAWRQGPECGCGGGRFGIWASGKANNTVP